MDEQHFNLIDEPWLKVLDLQGKVQLVSLTTLFANAHHYRRLAGDTRSQDLVILRLLLAILQTVYSRVDASGRPYPWRKQGTDLNTPSSEVDADDDTIVEALFETWGALNEGQTFMTAVDQYFKQWHDRFDFFGERPFYQATRSEYDQLVLLKNQIKTGTGTVGIKQIDRRVSESGNSPAVFAPKAGLAKDKVSLDELIRWVITYQNFTGVTDKSKISTDEKYSNSGGWLYKLNPVFAKGETLFETLMLNLILVHPLDQDQDTSYHLQRPQWEWPSSLAYVEDRKRQLMPDNLAELYTAWSRMLHIQWGATQDPIIFSAGIPIFDHANAFIEPMTTWHAAKKAKVENFLPSTKRLETLDIAMWRQFGQYVRMGKLSQEHEPNIVSWLRRLKQQKLIPKQKLLALQTVGLVSDGNMSSQSPAAEFVDDFQVHADILFDGSNYWPIRIDDTIEVTRSIAQQYRSFLTQVEALRNLTDHDLADREQAKFYEALNAPFKAWLASLSGEDRDAQIKVWYQTLQRLVVAQAAGFMAQATAQDLRGKVLGKDNKKYYANIFIANNVLQAKVWKILFG